MVPGDLFAFKNQQAKKDKNGYGNGFLNDFELQQTKRPAIALKTDTVGRHLKTILKKGNAPTDKDDGHQPQVFAPAHFRKFEMAIPGQRHKRIGDGEQSNGIQSFHGINTKRRGKRFKNFLER